VLSLDRDTNRIALSRKRLLPDPWSDAMNRYHEGQQVEGTVTNVVDFGAFIALDDGLEGLLHLSEMGDGMLKEPHSYVKKGDRLQLVISRLEPDKRRVGFTQRWGMNAPGEEGEAAPGEGAEGAEIVEGSEFLDAPEAVADVAPQGIVDDLPQSEISESVEVPVDEVEPSEEAATTSES
jgi:small subunit ribosomal protein S1